VCEGRAHFVPKNVGRNGPYKTHRRPCGVVAALRMVFVEAVRILDGLVLLRAKIKD
jgi:hypothetical protein